MFAAAGKYLKKCTRIKNKILEQFAADPSSVYQIRVISVLMYDSKSIRARSHVIINQKGTVNLKRVRVGIIKFEDVNRF